MRIKSQNFKWWICFRFCVRRRLCLSRTYFARLCLAL